MAKNGRGQAQIWQLAEPRIQCRASKSEMGYRYFLHSNSRRVLYLSMIRDLYDRSIVAYRTGSARQSILYWIPFILQWSLWKQKVAGSCTSTATKGSNTPHKHISTWLKNTAFCRLCQGVETAMTMRWLKTFSESSKRSASTETSRNLWGSQQDDRWLHLLLQPRTHPTKNRTVSTFASSVRLRHTLHEALFIHVY